jgi:CRP-like cAMP-binding protein
MRIPKRLPKSPASDVPVHNEILIGLSPAECKAIFPSLVYVELKTHLILQDVGQEVEFGYFVNSGIVSLLTVMSDGDSVEVGVVGKGGFIGAGPLVGIRKSGLRAITQIPGDAFRISIQTLRRVVQDFPKLAQALQRNAQIQGLEAAQTAACNRLHTVEKRLAKWLLMCGDRTASDNVPLTQDFLAQMLGVRRPSVSVAASFLQKDGLIEYRRGRVRISNRPALEKAACECYAMSRKFDAPSDGS